MPGLLDVNSLKTVVNNLLSPITGVGETITFSRALPVEYNPIDGSVFGISNTTYTCSGHPRNISQKEILTEDVIVGDIKISVVSNIIPMVADTFSCSLGTYKIINIQPISVEGQVVFYKLTARV